MVQRITDVYLCFCFKQKTAYEMRISDWSSDVCSSDLGDEGQMFKSYEKGRAFKEDEGILEAAFDGSHGWFWRNRGSSDVTVTLRTRDRKSTRLNSSH